MMRRDSRRRVRAACAGLAASLFVLTLDARGPVQTPQTRAGIFDASPRQTNAATVRLRMTAERAARIARANAEGLDYVPGEVIVQFRDGMSQAALARTMSAVPSASGNSRLRWAGRRAVLTSDTMADAHELAAIVGADPEVLYAEPNYLARIGPADPAGSAPLTGGARPNAVPNDPEYATRQWNFEWLQMPRAWDINPGGDPSVIVAIIDSGITTQAHTLTLPIWTGSSFTNPLVPFAVSPDLSPSRLVSPIDLIFFEAGGPVLDMDGHGTHVASTVAQETNNGFGLAGMAYNVRLMPVKVCYGYWEEMYLRAQDGIPGFASPDAGNCPFSAIAEAIEYATDNGARVINISLGGTGQSNAVRQAMQYAIERGVFISMSGGNRAQTGNQVGYPAFYGQQFGGAMAVSAVTRSRLRAPYSSTGSYIEIAAPGGSTSDGGAAGAIWQATIRRADSSTNRLFNGFPAVVEPRFDRFESTGLTGTSMAAPHVAGLAALLISQGITEPSLIEQIIRLSARDLGEPGRDDEFGYGLIDPRAALFGLGIR
ncbi:MAG TPA: S8 family serine peptidase [Vicinamibacterales bacterium]|nr:S8 family serine peptidase [Vicinamibacterales bacterium]